MDFFLSRDNILRKYFEEKKEKVTNTHHGFARPVEITIMCEAFPVVEILEELPQVLVVGRVEEIEPANVAQVRGHLFGMTLTELLDRSRAFRVADLLVALLQRVRFEALPWQAATQEVHEHVAQRLQVISPTLLCG